MPFIATLSGGGTGVRGAGGGGKGAWRPWRFVNKSTCNQTDLLLAVTASAN